MIAQTAPPSTGWPSAGNSYRNAARYLVRVRVRVGVRVRVRLTLTLTLTRSKLRTYRRSACSI